MNEKRVYINEKRNSIINFSLFFGVVIFLVSAVNSNFERDSKNQINYLFLETLGQPAEVVYHKMGIDSNSYNPKSLKLKNNSYTQIHTINSIEYELIVDENNLLKTFFNGHTSHVVAVANDGTPKILKLETVIDSQDRRIKEHSNQIIMKLGLAGLNVITSKASHNIFINLNDLKDQPNRFQKIKLGLDYFYRIKGLGQNGVYIEDGVKNEIIFDRNGKVHLKVK